MKHCAFGSVLAHGPQKLYNPEKYQDSDSASSSALTSNWKPLP